MTSTAAALHGVGVSPGRASGPVVWVADWPAEPPVTIVADPAGEASRILPAAQAVSQRLARRAEQVGGDARAVLEVTAAMAADPALISQAEQRVSGTGLSAARAVYDAANAFADSLADAGGYLAERARDIHDIRDRLVAELTGVQPPGVPELTKPAVLLARDLAPADTADLDPGLVLALVTEEGGPTSHTAILARSLGIPAVVAVRGLLAHEAAGIIVDGATGTVELLDHAVPGEAATRVAQTFTGEGHTADGHGVALLANVGSRAEAQAAARAGAQGIGLFRTELCYLAATTEPDIETQRAAYAEVLTQFGGKPVVVRTLDAGADKPLPFLGVAPEPNPALGVRGLRIAFDRQDLLDRQLEAIAAAAGSTGADVSVMAPMVATAAEAAWFAERAHAAGIARAGVMIEIPAAVLSIPEILAAVDFVSIGTNDLAQYAFAADRMDGALAALNDPWQPALLRLVDAVGRAGQELGKPVGVCGEAAADPLLAGVLTGLGMTSLSMTSSALPDVAAALARYPLAAHQQAARAAVAAARPEQARQAAREALNTAP